MAEIVNDENRWHSMWLDTPFRGETHARADQHTATCLPGNAVKSKELGGDGWPKYTGILVIYDDECIVRGHGSPVSPKFVWRGSKAEYHHTWIVD